MDLFQSFHGLTAWEQHSKLYQKYGSEYAYHQIGTRPLGLEFRTLARME